MDGEVTHMKPPLHYRVRPLALRVIVPRENQVKGFMRTIVHLSDIHFGDTDPTAVHSLIAAVNEMH